jgi:hypothetical protein
MSAAVAKPPAAGVDVPAVVLGVVLGEPDAVGAGVSGEVLEPAGSSAAAPPSSPQAARTGSARPTPATPVSARRLLSPDAAMCGTSESRGVVETHTTHQDENTMRTSHDVAVTDGR